jgi:hypothetical protein
VRTISVFGVADERSSLASLPGSVSSEACATSFVPSCGLSCGECFSGNTLLCVSKNAPSCAHERPQTPGRAREDVSNYIARQTAGAPITQGVKSELGGGGGGNAQSPVRTASKGPHPSAQLRSAHANASTQNRLSLPRRGAAQAAFPSRSKAWRQTERQTDRQTASRSVMASLTLT